MKHKNIWSDIGKYLGCDTHTNQSTAQRRDTSATGTLMAERTINIRTRAALGTLALAILAAVAVKLDKYFLTAQIISCSTYTTVT